MIQSAYYTIRTAVALVNSPYYTEVIEAATGERKAELQKFKADIKKKEKKIGAALLNARLNSTDGTNEELKKIASDLQEFVRLKTILPDSSQDTIVQVDRKLEELDYELHDQLDYSPLYYFYSYFIGITQGISESKAMIKDIRKSPAFKYWFGESKAVDSKGNPMIVYHGTGGMEEPFTKWDFDSFPAAYFGENKSYAKWFAKSKKGSGESFMYPVYLRVLNPLDLRSFGVDKILYDDFVNYIELRYNIQLPEHAALKAQSDQVKGIEVWRYLRSAPEWLKHINLAAGFDGIKMDENNPDDKVKGEDNVTPAWIVFKPEQIKLATGQNLLYSPKSPDVRFEKGGEL